MPWNIQRDDPRARAHKKELDDSTNRLISRGQTKEKAIDGFEQELADYNGRIDKGETMKMHFVPFRRLSSPSPPTLGINIPVIFSMP